MTTNIRHTRAVERQYVPSAGRDPRPILRERELTDGDAFEMLSALYTAAVDLLDCRRGQSILRQLIIRYGYYLRWGKPIATVKASEITNILNRSPILVVDSTMQRDHIGMWHPRDWKGRVEDANNIDVLRYQEISVSPYWLHQVLYYKRAFQGSSSNGHEFYVAAFRIISMFLHELGYLIARWATDLNFETARNPGQGRRRIAMPNLDPPLEKAGELMELHLFGGHIEFYHHRFHENRKIYPWVCAEDALRVDVDLLRHLIFDNLDIPANDMLVRTIPNSETIERLGPENRPLIRGLEHSEGRMVSIRERRRSWAIPLRIETASLVGRNWEHRYLRELLRVC